MEQERNLNWFICPVLEGCRFLVVCADGELFDGMVERGLLPLHDDRKYGEVCRIPCFIGWTVETDRSNLGTWLVPREAK